MFCFYFYFADVQKYFDNELNAQSTIIDIEKSEFVRRLHSRCSLILSKWNLLKNKCDGSTTNGKEKISDGDNASYLDMSIKKPDEIDEPIDVRPNDYVDIVEKCDDLEATQPIDDENIYDNFMVESENGKSLLTISTHQRIDIQRRIDCPFGGLPAAHLSIKKSRKNGWLTMNCRRRSYLNILNLYMRRKYFVGLVAEQNDMGNDIGWWMLMYADGPTALKPTLCVDLKSFELTKIEKKTKTERRQSKRDEKLKFELREKTIKTPSKSSTCIYRLWADTNETTEQWFSIISTLKEIHTTINRQLPKLPPPNETSTCVSDEIDASKTIDNESIMYCNQEMQNFSEGVYEEPEECNRPKTVPTLTTFKMNTPIVPTVSANATVATNPTQSIQSIDRSDILAMYDFPKSPARSIHMVHDKLDQQSNDKFSPTIEKCVKRLSMVSPSDVVSVDNADDYDNVIVCDGIPSPALQRENSGKKIHEIRMKLSSHFKDQVYKYPVTMNTRKSAPIKSIVDDKSNEEAKSTLQRFVARIRRTSILKSPKSMQRNECRKNSTTICEFDEKTDENPQQKSNEEIRHGKVHMIINQLEANGQLTLVGGAGTSRITTK